MKNNLESSIIYEKFIDESNEWTDTAVALQVPYYLMSYDLNGTDGDMKFVFTNTNMTINANTNNTEMYSKLCSHFFTTGYSFEVGEISNTKVDSTNGTVSMDAELSNTGVKTIKQISVLIQQYYPDTTEVKKYYNLANEWRKYKNGYAKSI